MNYNQKQVEDLIYSYHWASKEVDRLEKIIFGSIQPMRNWGVAQYGIEAAMPKGSKGKSKSEIDKMDLREERLYNRLLKYREKIYAVEQIAQYLETRENDIQNIMLDCMMEGMSYKSISVHLGINRETLRSIKDKMLNDVCQNCQFLELLKLG